MRKVLLVAVVVALGAWLVLASLLGPAPEVVPAGRPANVPASDVTWHTVPLPNDRSTPVGVIRAADGNGADRPAILLVTGTEGLNTDYLQFARELAARGFDVAVGCWFRTEGATGPGTAGIACPHAPKFTGVTDRAVTDLDALVSGVQIALGGPSSLALVGFSRGAGVAMLRATHGSPEPVVSVSGMLEGTTGWGELPGEVDVVERASGVRAPVLLLHGENDFLVPISQAKHMADALHTAGADVQIHWYPNAGHGLAQDPAIRADLEQRIADWLMALLSRPASRRAAG